MFEKEINMTISILNRYDICLDKGMTEYQIKQAEEYYQFIFPIELRALLMTVLPVSLPFYDWTDYSEENQIRIQQYLNWPIDGILFDIEHNSFWLPKYWGNKPESIAEQLKIAEQYIRQMPKLVPIYSHRYIPSSFNQELTPVFSAYQTDIIYYGNNLWHYFEYEFGPKKYESIDLERIKFIPFWSDLAG